MNPWVDVPSAEPFVLPIDQAAVLGFNRELRQYSNHWIHTGRLPEPRQGPIDAAIVLLQLNPSYDKNTQTINLTALEIQDGRAALADEGSEHRCLAEPNTWWDSAFKTLIAEFGRPRLARRVCSIEYFAYPSLKFGHGDLELASRSYQTLLVQQAIKRGAIFIVSKGLSMWVSRVPHLAELKGKSLFETKNRQRVWITPDNLSGGTYDVIRSVL